MKNDTKKNMDKFKETLILIDSGEFNLNELVSLLVLITQKLTIHNFSDMAKKKGMTPRGVKISNRFKKIEIGGKKFCIDGVNDDQLPF